MGIISSELVILWLWVFLEAKDAAANELSQHIMSAREKILIMHVLCTMLDFGIYLKLRIVFSGVKAVSRRKSIGNSLYSLKGLRVYDYLCFCY